MERERKLEKKNEKFLNGKTIHINLKTDDNQSGSILFRFSRIRNVLWDRLKANISRRFRIHQIPLLKLLYFTRKNDRE